jgi:hypothetical protein
LRLIPLNMVLLSSEVLAGEGRRPSAQPRATAHILADAAAWRGGAHKSRYLPRFLGVLLPADGIAVMIWFLQALLFPAYPAVSTRALVVSFIAEFGLALWLLIKAVKEVPDSARSREPRWKAGMA